MANVRFLDQALFQQLAGAAALAERKRDHFLFHQGDEPCQRLAIGLQPETYITPHRHLCADKAEQLIVLRGEVGVLIFDDAGQVSAQRTLRAVGDCLGVDISPGTYHTLVALERDSILFECKAGPYRAPTPDEWAPWAPREGAAGAIEYLAWLRGHFAV